MTPNASRAPVDFDAFERDLQHPTSVARSDVTKGDVTKGDPLAELARIVGQDDPFRALLQVRDANAGAAASARAGRIEPTFVEDGPAHRQATQHHGPADHARQPAIEPGYGQPYEGHGPEVSPADAFNQYLASVEQGGYGEGDPRGQGEAEFSGGEPEYRKTAAEKPRHRNRLVSVGAGLGVLVVCVTGAMTWRGLHSEGGGGNVPTIMADKAPLKIAPKTADGVEIPDQNKQIYDRNPKEAQIRIVNREEQPVDVAQAARAAPRPGEAGATPATATPGAPQGTLTESLGEPRRVRTVSVKPDTPPPAQQREVPAQAADTTPPSVIPNMVMPGGDGTATTASLRPRGNRMAQMTTPAPAAEAEAPAAPAPTPTPRPKPPQKMASAAAEAVAPAPAVTSGPVGGFSVQLGVRTSQGEAQAAFRQMQGKYAQLSGKPALIRQAEVNGKTIFRVRVGPLGKDEATSLCSELQGAGGQCFVAKN